MVRALAPTGFVLGLAAVAGMVDVIGYVVLGHLYTAHMSGNTASIGAAFATGDVSRACVVAAPLPPFVLGVAVGAAIQEQWGVRCRRALLLCEALLLLGFVLLAHAAVARAAWCGCVALLASAMGIQTTIIRRVGALGVRTTFVTGMLASGTEEAVAAWRAPSGTRRVTTLVVHLGIWTVFALAACLGGVIAGRFGAQATLLPMALVALAAVVAPTRSGHGRAPSRHPDG